MGRDKGRESAKKVTKNKRWQIKTLLHMFRASRTLFISILISRRVKAVNIVATRASCTACAAMATLSPLRAHS